MIQTNSSYFKYISLHPPSVHYTTCAPTRTRHSTPQSVPSSPTQDPSTASAAAVRAPTQRRVNNRRYSHPAMRPHLPRHAPATRSSLRTHSPTQPLQHRRHRRTSTQPHRSSVTLSREPRCQPRSWPQRRRRLRCRCCCRSSATSLPKRESPLVWNICTPFWPVE